MYFAIRDDDISYYTTPDELDTAYKGLEHIPVSLSVIPDACYVHGENRPYNTLQSQNKYMEIDKNTALVKYIQTNKAHFEVLMHGFHHEYIKTPSGFVPEMFYLSYRDIHNMMRNYRAYLEGVFNTKITVFVPPSNLMNKSGFRCLDIFGMNTMSTISKSLDHPISIRYLYYYIERNTLKVLSKERRRIRKYINHYEIDVFPLSTLDIMWKQYLQCKKDGIPFIIYTHYWEINADEKKRLLLKQIISKMESDNAQPRFVSNCFKTG